MSSTSRGASDDEIRHRIRQLRIERNMTQEDLAKGKYSVSYISALERGAVAISQRALRWCAEKLGVSVSELQGDTALSAPDVQWIRQQLGRRAYEQATAEVLLMSGGIEEGLRRVRRLRADADATMERALVWFSAYGALQAGDLDEARREAAVYQQFVETTNDARGHAALHWLQGKIALANGDKEEAHREFSRAQEARPAEFGDPDTAQAIRRALAEVTRSLGDFSGARRIEREVLREYERATNPAQSLNWARARAEKAANTSDYVTACLLIRWASNSQRDMAVHRHAAELYLRRATDAGESLTGEQREAALRRAVMLAELTGDAELRLLASAYQAQLLAERGAPAVAEEVMRLTAPDPAGDDAPGSVGAGGEQEVALKLARGWMAAARGSEQELAHRLAQEVDAVLEKPPDFTRTGSEYAGLALSRLFERLGDTEHAFYALRRVATGQRALSG